MEIYIVIVYVLIDFVINMVEKEFIKFGEC